MFFNAFPRKLAGFLALYLSLAVPALAYEVEADSTANTVYLLLNNTNPAASFDSVTVGENSPAFVSASSVSIVPATVPANGSELAALEFENSDDLQAAQRNYELAQRTGVTPECVAERIIKAIEKNAIRIRIGKDAVLLDWLKRWFPISIQKLFRKIA